MELGNKCSKGVDLDLWPATQVPWVCIGSSAAVPMPTPAEVPLPTPPPCPCTLPHHSPGVPCPLLGHCVPAPLALPRGYCLSARPAPTLAALLSTILKCRPHPYGAAHLHSRSNASAYSCSTAAAHCRAAALQHCPSPSCNAARARSNGTPKTRSCSTAHTHICSPARPDSRGTTPRPPCNPSPPI